PCHSMPYSHVVVVFKPGDASEFRGIYQLLLYSPHCSLNHRMTGIETAKVKKAEQRGVQDYIRCCGFVANCQEPTQKAAKFPAVKMLSHGRDDLVRRVFVNQCFFVLRK